MSFRSGERYRLGYGQRGGLPERDDWTGTVVELDVPWDEGLWRCRRGGELIIVSEERLRAAARLASEE